MTVIYGDILTPPNSRPTIVCHQVNCKGVMGAGLAKQIRDKYPVVYEAYKERCLSISRGIGGIGDVQLVPINNIPTTYMIANVFGQYGYGRNSTFTDYIALRKAFNKLAKGCSNYVIRIPYGMGCGLGGGDWTVVSKIIEEELVSKEINVEIWKIK